MSTAHGRAPPGRASSALETRASTTAVLGLDDGVAAAEGRVRPRRTAAPASSVIAAVGRVLGVQPDPRHGLAGDERERPAYGVGPGGPATAQLVADQLLGERQRQLDDVRLDAGRRPRRSGRLELGSRAGQGGDGEPVLRASRRVLPRPGAGARARRRPPGASRRRPGGPRPSRWRSPGRGQRRGASVGEAGSVSSVTASPRTASPPSRVQSPRAQLAGARRRHTVRTVRHACLRRRTHRRCPGGS